MRKNSVPIRACPEFAKMVQKTKGSYLIKGKNISIPRITLGMFRQYSRNPNLLKELEENIK